jgi:hypothetical protein
MQHRPSLIPRFVRAMRHQTRVILAGRKYMKSDNFTIEAFSARRTKRLICQRIDGVTRCVAQIAISTPTALTLFWPFI